MHIGHCNQFSKKKSLGPPSSRPSQLVEKIIDRIRNQERLRRQTSGLSLSNIISIQAAAKKPKLGFARIVNQAMEKQNVATGWFF